MLPKQPENEDNKPAIDTITNPSIEHLEGISNTLDSQFKIPYTDRHFGYDVILGLVPGVGDGASTAISGYIIAQAYRLGTPVPTLLRMVTNVGIDFIGGAVPVFGTMIDGAWKANEKNMDLARSRIHHPQKAKNDTKFLLAYVLPAIIFTIVIFVVLFIVLLYFVWNSTQESVILDGIISEFVGK